MTICKLEQAPEFLETVVAMLDGALPDWPNLERGLNAASALASASPPVRRLCCVLFDTR